MLTLRAPLSKGKFLGLMTAGLASATLGLAASPAQAVTNFAGDYAPGNWTQSIGGDGSINTGGAPTIITLTGADDSGGDQNTDFTIAPPTAGTVSFNWSYVTNDISSPYWDPFGYLLNGVFTPLTDSSGALTQSGFASFSVLATDLTFGFRQNSVDSSGGFASTTISNFNGPIATASVPGPLPILGVGAAFVYSRRLRRRINLAKSPVSTDSVVAEQL